MAAGSENKQVAKLNGNHPDKRVGPSLVLKVMAGDTISIGAKAFYKSIGTQQSKQLAPVGDMATALVRAFGGGEPGRGNSHTPGNTPQPRTPFNDQFVNDGYQRMKEKEPADPAQANRPRAYLNFALFDEQFNLVEDNSGVKQVKAEPDQLQTLAQDKMVIKQGGFLYVYTSNETPQDVFFDNLTVLNSPGPVLEETHYYPFGLAMDGISAKAINKLEQNKYGYNGKELQNGEFGDNSGLEWYDYGARMYDPQIGRWHVGDPAADKWNMYSPYMYAVNDPTNIIDPDGKDAVYSYDEKTKTITVKAKIYYKGKELPAGEKARAEFIGKLNNELKEVYKDGTINIDDAEYSIKFDVTAEINEDIKQEDLKQGENIMEVDESKTRQPDGSLRAGVRGGKSNMGYLGGKAGNLVNIHEIGHMIGLKDRYTDYENSSNTRLWRSLVHENYKNDIMGGVEKNLNRSHYENIVKYTVYMLNQGQRNLLPQYRSNSINVIQNIDANSTSAPAAADIPPGWRPRGVK